MPVKRGVATPPALERRWMKQGRHVGAIKSRSNADLKLHTVHRHYWIASSRVTAAFLSYLPCPRRERNTREQAAEGLKGQAGRVLFFESHEERRDV